MFKYFFGREQESINTDPLNSDTNSYLKYADKPQKAWRFAQSSQVFKEVELPINEPKKEGHVRVVCISDTHGRIIENVPEGDILIHAGDFTKRGKIEEVEKFNQFLGSLNHPHKVVIAGNHDIGFHEESAQRMHGKNFVPEAEVKAALTDCTYLQDSEVDILGLRIYGSPWTPAFRDWAFNEERGDAIDEIWKKIPKDIDILVTHGPPLGRCDVVAFGRSHAGCANLLDRVQNHIKPRYHIFGHIHEDHLEMSLRAKNLFNRDCPSNRTIE
ncbi:metallophosphoesterase domain-containing protein 1-like isoform X2 [Dendronephthya gigantea]|uniref:metallophosphoesterase domain-containing protein 1-like isoform X2 n=1 Tax=Dendronephthya gigantea TaxID=151771 RepID=UPI00106C6C7E|nr:metallophosphoesterase domain-containing protein 1-like isoform X2 [Dendronephthya gigantea]